jgi:PD-(D/E)XK endonuclease
VLTTNQKGAIAELAIAQAAVELDIDVYWPMADGGRYDLIFDVRGRLFRVQCKWASRYDDVLVVRCYRSRRNRDGLLNRRYTAQEIDAFAAYCAELNRCYFLPIDRFAYRRQIQLRLGPTRNNQRLLVNWASDFEFGATLSPSGAVAQLGERSDGIRKAAGSSPAGST